MLFGKLQLVKNLINKIPFSTIKHKDFKAAPLKAITDLEGPITKRDINNIIEQNNYTNLYLSTMKTSTPPISSTKPNVPQKAPKVTKPFFPPSASPSMPSYKTPLSSEFFDILTSKLSQLSIGNPTTSSPAAAPVPPLPSTVSYTSRSQSKDKGPVVNVLTTAPTAPNSSSSSDSDKESVADISSSNSSSIKSESHSDSNLPEIYKIFRRRNSRRQSNPQFRQNRYPLSKQYYSRPSPSDLILEEKIKRNQKYDGNAIYDWSIDGLSEYQIIEVVLKMHIYAKASILQNHTEPDTAKAIVCGFTANFMVGGIIPWMMMKENQFLII
ncbi:hypothetical protein Scep_021485 [Stephania cephalantha]|uniref:DUF7746 domain-containing protein n=1 Tax=Stephania cephalantha TaxID=152367 RepID=A0AAP0I1G1_9MAGN